MMQQQVQNISETQSTLDAKLNGHTATTVAVATSSREPQCNPSLSRSQQLTSRSNL